MQRRLPVCRQSRVRWCAACASLCLVHAVSQAAVCATLVGTTSLPTQTSLSTKVCVIFYAVLTKCSDVWRWGREHWITILPFWSAWKLHIQRMLCDQQQSVRFGCAALVLFHRAMQWVVPSMVVLVLRSSTLHLAGRSKASLLTRASR